MLIINLSELFQKGGRITGLENNDGPKSAGPVVYVGDIVPLPRENCGMEEISESIVVPC